MNANLTGRIESGLLPDVVQILAARSDLAGRLIIRGTTREGWIWFRDGRMVTATFGTLRDERAIERIFSLKRGAFAFEESAAVPETTIAGSAMSVLLECMRKVDEGPATMADDGEAAPVAIQAQAAVPANDAPPPSSFVLKQKSAPDCGVGQLVKAVALPSSEAPDRLEHQWRARPPVLPTPVPAASNVPARLAFRSPATTTPAQESDPTPRPRAAVGASSRRPIILMLAGGLAALMLVCINVWTATPPASATRPTPVVKPTPAPAASTPGAATLHSPAPIPTAGAPFVWPPLELSGILAGRQGQHCALLNGHFIAEGDSLNGVRIQSIAPGRVTVSYQGHSKILPMAAVPPGIQPGFQASLAAR